jgi:hypothetical protein
MKRLAYCFFVIAQLSLVSCAASKPSDVAKTFINYWVEQDVDRAVGLFSSKFIDSNGGIAATKSMLSGDLFRFVKNANVHIDSVKIEQEDTAGPLAELHARVNFTALGKSQTTEPFEFLFKFKFIQENNAWKIDFVTAADQPVRKDPQKQTPNPSTPQPTKSLDDEAIATVRDLWEQHTTQCGDSYFSQSDFAGTRQYKGVSFSARQTGPTSEADRLNGILWNGEVQIRTTAYRHKNNDSWSDWSQDRTMSQGWYNVGATKRGSGWSVVQLLAITDQRKVKCSEVAP